MEQNAVSQVSLLILNTPDSDSLILGRTLLSIPDTTADHLWSSRINQINTVSGYTVSQTFTLISSHTETMGVIHPVSKLPHEHVSQAYDTILGCTASQILVLVSPHTKTIWVSITQA